MTFPTRHCYALSNIYMYDNNTSIYGIDVTMGIPGSRRRGRAAKSQTTSTNSTAVGKEEARGKMMMILTLYIHLCVKVYLFVCCCELK
jgi:hypothetical protein